MRKVAIILVVLIGSSFISCKSDVKSGKPVEGESIESTLEQEVLTTEELEDIVTLYVSSEKSDCAGVAEMKCLLVKETEDAPWELMYDTIEGFVYEEGYEYNLEIRRENVTNPPADGSSIRYVLIREISKVKK
ncbi:DUF4377 domain-containing protein [Myroides pelagicus]|uniref:DUF4377 domain-containing protein n=1 Tax=Myroides pelagicus TaxID=270914 RepID=A0A7K1GRF8_9FLAO|nr:DUF4377 domain-containing protein [Myroides pelagicus]MTH30624.1 DUF4377 domain-containing protein [Myroides pelagicus]